MKLNNFNCNLKYKPTSFLIVGIIILIIGIPFGLYALTLNGGGSLGGVLVLLGVAIFLPFFNY